LPLSETLVRCVSTDERLHVARERQLARVVSPHRRVVSGPFAGMRYEARASGSALLPKLAGTYELEIHEAIERAIAQQPDVVVDVGAAEGYYAVGLARRLPHARTIAFESRRSARYLCGRLAAANSAEATVKGPAGSGDLEAALAGSHRPFVLCDIDGGEHALMDPDRVRGLSSALMIVETHDHRVPGVTARLQARFASTHEVAYHESRPRDPAKLPDLSADDALRVLDERRSKQGWLVLTPFTQLP
jgi:hypothetical protein